MGILLRPITHATKRGPHRRLRLSGLLVIVALTSAVVFAMVGIGGAA